MHNFKTQFDPIVRKYCPINLYVLPTYICPCRANIQLLIGLKYTQLLSENKEYQDQPELNFDGFKIVINCHES